MKTANALPYYITWSKQKNATPLQVLATSKFCLKTKKYGELYDLSSLSFHASFSLRPTQIQQRIAQELKLMPLVSSKASYPLKNKVTTDLIKLINLKGGKIFYTVSGAEAIENALKLARHLTKRTKILAREKSYHGATMGALAATGDWRNEGHVLPRDLTLRMPEPANDLQGEQLRALIEKEGPEHIAALCVETVSGANGVDSYPASWWQAVQKLRDKYGFKLIVDEVICGFYRLGTPFGFQYFGVTPDLVVMAKAISAGIVPFGAVWTGPEFVEYYQDNLFSFGLTQYANPIGLASLAGVLELCKSSSFKKTLKANSKLLHQELERWQKEGLLVTHKKVGMLACASFERALAPEEIYSAGLYLVSKGNDLILCPALNYPTPLLKKQLFKLESLLKKSKGTKR